MEISEKTLDFHYHTPVVDLHADTFMCMRLLKKVGINYDFLKEHKQRFPLSAFLNHVDEPRMKKGGVNLQGFGVVTIPYIDRNKNESAKETIRLIHKTIRRTPDLVLVRNTKEWEEAWTNGQIGAIIGVEGAQSLEGNLDNLDKFHKMGVSYLGLSHFNKNEAAYPAITGKQDRNKPLTEFGKDLISKMNDLGMIIDLAHINHRGFMQTAYLSKKPVIVSHTGIYNRCGNEKRNLFDDQIHAVAETNGVIGIMFAPYFLHDKWTGSVKQIVDNMEYVRDLVGIDYVTIGADFDGLTTMPEGITGTDSLPAITQEMFNRNWPEEDIKKVLGENFLRVYKEVCD